MRDATPWSADCDGHPAPKATNTGETHVQSLAIALLWHTEDPARR